ncbi:breast cancer anti-estrogen resistance protein 3 homolog isoform X1 [Carcharodon carcharias]|uniref:breast cancer anti-estrogen resistance protein 3 homolog isoform X1 n=1 Tax=Carcharodon carcharias TaxID=13397 RepID=UPI001B7E326B|nr:breast cancer anti-estrogen resistance protein 3 homolog isoform X1 [Carcharodon carcharias]XP_041033295.1 breast cancer anti-estrogen resistance protein 3 homolog isoform X1 [Carcharodon carcharias]
MTSGKDPLTKELEEELKRSTDDLCSHAWFHGPIPRQVAEALIERDGDFLIRESRSSPGDYVLSCTWKHEPLHFKIIRVVLRPKESYTRVLFQFEQESFDNLPALVRFYVGNRKPISEDSGAIIFHPINRTVPLRCIEEKHRGASGQRPHDRHLAARNPDQNKRFSLNLSEGVSLDQLAADSNLLRNKDKSGSHPNILDYGNDKKPLQSAQSDSYLSGAGPKDVVQANGTYKSMRPSSLMYRTGSDPLINPKVFPKRFGSQSGMVLRGSDGQLHCKAPPKPLRIPSVMMSGTPLDPTLDRSVYCELVPHVPPASQIPSSAKTHVEKLRTTERIKSRTRRTDTDFGLLDLDAYSASMKTHHEEANEDDDDEDWSFVRPHLETTSSFKLDTFASILLPADNKPLDPIVLKHLKEIFADNDAKTTALHILKVDCQVARITNVSLEQKKMMGVSSGLALITLPHGHQLRVDLLVRHHLIALGIAVDILGCTGSVGQRSAVLHKIIQLAVELKDSIGDLFGLSAIMKALELPQIVRLEHTWRTLRRNHTDSAIKFEKELKPFTKSLNEGKAELPLQNITIPHILPIITLMERQSVSDVMETWDNIDQSCTMLLKTLEAARTVTLNAATYRANAEAKLKDFQAKDELLEAFKTEFALKLFWGASATEVSQNEGYEKFDKILSALSRKLEPLGPSEI